MSTPNKQGRDLAQVAGNIVRDLGEDFKRPFSYKIFLLGLVLFFIATVFSYQLDVLGILLGWVGFAMIVYPLISFWGWLKERGVFAAFEYQDFKNINKKNVSERDKAAYKIITENWDDAMDIIGTAQTDNYTENFAVRAVKSHFLGKRYDPKKEITYRPKPERAYSDRFGLNFDMRTPQGWTPERLEKVLPVWAEYIKYPMKLTSPSPGYVKITALTAGDVLKGVRASVPEPHGTRALIARGEDGNDVYLDFKDATHTVVQGITRSGKSMLMYVTFAQLAQASNVQIWGADPNALLLSPVAHTLSEEERSRRIVIGNDPEATLAMLERLVGVMRKRNSALDKVGVDKIDRFTDKLPVIVCALEEYMGILSSADKKTKDAIKAQVSMLTAQGAKAGIRLVFILQRAEAAIMDGSTRANCMQRITLAEDNNDSIRLLHEGLDEELQKAPRGFPVGRFLIKQHQDTRIGQGDLLEYQDYRAALGLTPITEEEALAALEDMDLT